MKLESSELRALPARFLSHAILYKESKKKVKRSVQICKCRLANEPLLVYSVELIV